ncbi:hypothetical protein [Undibacterium sp. SXout20W]|uniref:hypothetical protein n=1 Tax=Undibacterium sp. SXout20W TaxID=3413051 RepID=UPI003BF1E2BB
MLQTKILWSPCRIGPLAVVFLTQMLLMPAVVDAAPAAYYVWKSKTSDAQLCAQTSPGEFWEKATGPYKDPHCEKLISPNSSSPPPIIILVSPAKPHQ